VHGETGGLRFAHNADGTSAFPWKRVLTRRVRPARFFVIFLCPFRAICLMGVDGFAGRCPRLLNFRLSA